MIVRQALIMGFAAQGLAGDTQKPSRFARKETPRPYAFFGKMLFA